MGKDSKIEWTHHTFNMVWGCVECAPECDHCYARVLAARYGHGWGKDAPRRTFGAKHWAGPLAWDRAAAKAGERHRVFCSSMADVFEDHPTVRDERPKLWSLIRRTPNLDWLLLTKRPGNFARDINQDHDEDGEPVQTLPGNVWAGTTLGHPKGMWRLRALKQVPARIRFLSVEPLLADLGELDLAGIHWVIVGGESGPGARPMHPNWFRSIRDQCRAAGVPLLGKQWGDWLPGGQVNANGNEMGGITWHNWGDGHHSLRVGKKVAGRTLDGVIHDGFPEPAEVARA